jgi:5-methylcytosine-specific restriction endonuclease McrA
MLPGSEAIVAEIARAANAMVAGDRAAADEAVGRIAHEPQQLEKRPALPRSTIAAVLWRDRSRCRYCGRACLPPSVLRLVSAIWPSSFPFDPHWKTNRTHVAYWVVSASVDHVRAGTMGGDWHDLENLVTACWPCQQAKGSTSLEQLGWELRAVPNPTGWDGLIGLYRGFWEAAGSPDPTVHRPWITAFERARSSHA